MFDEELNRISAFQDLLDQAKQSVLKSLNVLENFSFSSRMPMPLDDEDCLDEPSKVFLASSINLYYKQGEVMNKITIVSPDVYTTSVIIPAVKRLMARTGSFLFDVKEATVDYMPNDTDFRFFHFKDPNDDYIEEVVTDTELNLYASPEYLELHGEPKELHDLNQHNIIKPDRGDILTTVGKVEYLPIDYKQDYMKVDSLSSLFSAGEFGLGIVCVADKNIAMQKLKLEKINKLGDTCRIPLVVSTHKKIKSDPITEQFLDAIKEVAS